MKNEDKIKVISTLHDLSYYYIKDKYRNQKSSFIAKSYKDEDVTCLVSDLSGFTSTTRKYGAIHFTSIIIRMR